VNKFGTKVVYRQHIGAADGNECFGFGGGRLFFFLVCVWANKKAAALSAPICLMSLVAARTNDPNPCRARRSAKPTLRLNLLLSERPFERLVA
jgi:hypothetical protein